MRKAVIRALVLLVGISIGVIFQYVFPEPIPKLGWHIKTYLSPHSVPEVEGLSDCFLPHIEDFDEFKVENNKAILIVGHAYGRPGKPDSGDISEYLKEFLTKKGLFYSKIIFTGDVLYNPSLERWKSFKKYLSKYTHDLRIAPGNHDVRFGDNAYRDIFSQSFGFRYPDLLRAGRDRVLILDSTYHPWAIGQPAVELARNESDLDSNLFIFSHHIMRRNPLDIANSGEGYSDVGEENSAKFGELSSLYKNVFVISGDTGAFPHLPRVECKSAGNIRYISQGLGGHDEDKVLILIDDKIYTTDIR